VGYISVIFLGIALGAGCCGAGVWELQRKLRERLRDLEGKRKKAEELINNVRAKERQLDELRAQFVTLQELEQENHVLKNDLRATAVRDNKAKLDREADAAKWGSIDKRSQELAEQYLADTVKAVVNAVGPSNFSACKRKLQDAIANCREIGFDVPEAEEARLLADLRKEFEMAVRAQFEREEQARIKAQIREEEMLKREIERELKQVEREQAAIRAALDQALAAAKGEFTAEVERLQARLAEAEERGSRAMSMAQQTKAGHVYVISNIGSLGDGVFKIGMTRRLEPKERVHELSCAAVPFPFDVHMMIQCKDAPALENALHNAFRRHRINKANPRKEFFRVEITDIYEIVKQHHGEIEYNVDAEALEYRQSLTMPDDDALFIEGVYDAASEEEEIVTGD
jgi:hypothetical protein